MEMEKETTTSTFASEKKQRRWGNWLLVVTTKAEQNCISGEERTVSSRLFTLSQMDNLSLGRYSIPFLFEWFAYLLFEVD